MALGLLFVTVPRAQANPTFIIASWAYPDQYGQGIDAFTVYENSTGAWLIVGGFGPNVIYSDSGIFENWSVGVSIKLKCSFYLNNTVVGADDLADGRNYFRHTVTVTNFNKTVVFSQTNFTYFSSSSAYDPMFIYDYTVVLNFIPVYSEVYTATITYEVFY
jgi:hypothetical protein